MDKAKIEICQVKNGNEVTIDSFSVQFNPNSLEYVVYPNEKSMKGTVSEKGDTSSDTVHLHCDPTGRTGKAMLSVRLFYHTYYNSSTYSDVRDEIKRLRRAVRTSGNNTTDTITIKFSWGSLIHSGVVDSFSVSYQMFASDGTPVQAEVSFSIYGNDAEWTIAKANQMNAVKAALKDLYDIKLEDPLQTLWAWLYF